ncbi:MAG: hypothetical protein F6K08_22790 [Okeania sp. SIO1H6]|nr:hypothetical protein [Okeania sp. SIO1H6]
MKNEAQYELEKRVSIRVNKGNLTLEQGQFQLEVALGLINNRITTVPLSDYQLFETEARFYLP